MLKNDKGKFYLSLAIILSIGVVLAWEGIFNAKADINDDLNRIKDKKIAIAAYGLKEEALPRILESYDFTKNRIRDINDYFVNDDSLPDFIAKLENIADDTSNSLEVSFVDNPSIDKPAANPSSSNSDSAAAAAAKNKAKEAAKKDESYALRLFINGNFKQLAEFISRFESMPYYAYIDSININVSGREDKSSEKKILPGNLKSVLSIRVFKKQDLNEQE